MGQRSIWWDWSSQAWNMAFLVPHAEVLTQPLGAVRTQPSLSSLPLAPLAWGEPLSSMLPSETFPGSWTLTCSVNSGFWKEIHRRKCLDRQVRDSLVLSDSQGLLPLGCLYSQKPLLWVSSGSSEHTLYEHLYPCPPGPFTRFQIHGKEHTDPEFGLISAYLISTMLCLWETISVVWMHIGLLLVSRDMLTLQTSVTNTHCSSSQEPWF